MKQQLTTVTEADVRAIMSGLLNDLEQNAQAHPKWVTWTDSRTGLEVGEYQ
jgi:hypothetical protein